MAVLRTTIDTILQALIARLVAKEAVASAAQVSIVARRSDPPLYQPQSDILIRVGKARGTWDDAGGRVGFKKVRTIGVYCRFQQLLDKGASDEQWLIAEDQMQDAVYNALLDFLPLDGDGNALTTEALHLVEEAAPAKADNDEIGDCFATWELHYLPAGIDITDPG